MPTHVSRAILKSLTEFIAHQRHLRVKLVFSLCLISLLGAGLYSFQITPSVTASGGKVGPQASSSGVSWGGDGAPRVNFADPRAVNVSYAGSGPAQAALNGNTAQTLSTAVGDFDNDGTPDLVTAHLTGAGPVVALLRGNADAIFPRSVEAQKRKAQGTFSDAPFLDSASVVPAPVIPYFMAAGDFDGDGHLDIAMASVKGDQLYFVSGNGNGTFGKTTSVKLRGPASALAAGEVNRADGSRDLVVGVSAPDGFKLQVFEAPGGASNASAEEIALNGEATSIAIADLDGDGFFDIIASAGRELTLVHGRDRKLSFGVAAQRAVRAPVVERRSMPYAVSFVVTGNFTGDPRTDIGLLSSAGTLHLLFQDGAGTTAAALQSWTEKRLGNGSWPSASQLTAARVASLPTHSLVVTAQQTVAVVNDGTPTTNPDGTKSPTNWPEYVQATLSVTGGAAAVVPMRFTSDSLVGLAVLRNGRSAPTVVLPSVVMNFVVTTTADSGAGSLRQAIIDSNANPGADTISFAIGSGPQTIAPTSDLPPPNDPVTIDATTQPGFSGVPLITLNGAGTGSGIGLKIGGGSTTVRGLIIRNCSLVGVEFILVGNDHIEGCYLGTDGSVATPNGDGIRVFSVSGNVVGGTTAAARNVISGNTDSGIELGGVTLAGNTVQGNYIGTNAAGSAAVPNVGDGVFVNAKLSTIGGTTPADLNVISGNSGNGVRILNDNSISGTLVQGNYIGISATGSASVANALSGVRILNTSNHTIGGGFMGASNTIAGNTGAGVYVSDVDASGNLVQGNIIGGAGIGNGGKGVLVDLSSNNMIGGSLAFTTNVIWFNADDGITITNSSGNQIRRNFVLANGGLGIDLGDDGITANDANDPDAGANSLQNFPILAQGLGGPTTTVMGTLNSTPNTTFTIECYLNSACDPAGNGEGETFLGDLSVTTNGSGNASFSTTFAHASVSGQFLTATATNQVNNNTSEYSPCAPVCSFSIAPPSQSFTAASGTGSIAVTTGGLCNWTAVSSAAFVTITSGASGTGSGTVNFAVAGNTTVNPRTATITIQDQVFTITQAGCAYAIAPPSQTFTPAGGTGSITVTPTGDACPWTAVPSAGFVTITSGASGAGPGTVNFSVAVNNSTSPRSATITIAGQVFTINQDGCMFAIAPPNQSFTPAGGTGSITVTTTSTCPWTAVSSAGFVTVTSGASGTGNGTVNFSVAVNNSTAPRSATITVVNQVFTVNQAGCSFAISPPNQSFTSAGGTGMITVTTTSTCPWTAVSSAAFVTVTSGASGTGSGTVNFSVAVNNTITPRSATITVVDQVFTVNQAGAPCTFSILPTSQSFTASGGTGSVGVTAPTGCTWTAVSNDGFITVTSGASGNGNGTVNYSVAAKGDVGSRMGTITIAGQTFTVTQSGVDCLTFTIMPTSMNFPIAGGTGSVSVTTGGGCMWSAASNSPFIMITSGSTGTGNGTVNYSVAANPDPSPRTGTMTIAGQTFTVNQDGPCPLSILPSGRTLTSAAQSATISVTTDPTCTWTATESIPWLTITSGSSGTGNGTVTYSVQANGTGVQRQGTISVSGKIHTVKQNP